MGARDGLKPVHRRILHAMNERAWRSDKAYVKCAKIVGEVLGNYHPHGDSSVYDALVRMVQEFSLRVPLIDGQGNFGSVDGDNAAAYRYTEARLAKMAEELLRDIDKETVNFSPNFDDTKEQPDVLPANFPNILVNGSSGIAVGMATNIPPHNLKETIAAVVEVIKNPEIPIRDLIRIIQGPDFPTGGIVIGGEGLLSAYTTGKGSIRIRSKVEIEENAKGREVIVITEIPYQVNKKVLLEKIGELINEKVVEGSSNPVEARLIAQTLKSINDQMLKQGFGSKKRQKVGVVSFYQSQCRVIRDEIRKVNQGQIYFNAIDVEVNTVIRYQGKEKPIILVSLVRNDGRAKDISRSSRANVARFEYINVAMSRAQNLLVVFGARNMLELRDIKLPKMDSQGEEKKKIYKDIFDRLDRNARIYSARELVQAL